MPDGTIKELDLSKEFGESAKRFTVIAPGGQNNGYNKPENLSRITDHFAKLGINAEFVKAKDGLPVQDVHGAYTLVTRDQKAEEMAPRILDQHYGLFCIPGR